MKPEKAKLLLTKVKLLLEFEATKSTSASKEMHTCLTCFENLASYELGIEHLKKFHRRLYFSYKNKISVLLNKFNAKINGGINRNSSIIL